MDEIKIRPLSTMPEIQDVERLQENIWDSPERDTIPAHMLHALAHNGAALYGAFDGQRLVGFVLGVLGTDAVRERVDQVAAARLKMYSVIAGVLPEYQGKGVGYRLKLAQREFALRIGVRLITWTYDPLESVNAHFNFGKLGVVCHQYLRNFHGELGGLSAGIPTDRFEVEWWVTSNRVDGRVVKQRKPLQLDALLGGGAVLVNESAFDGRGLPVPPSKHLGTPDNNLLLVEIPADYQRIKREDIGLAGLWRQHSREVFESLFNGAFMATDFVYHRQASGLNRGFYLLTYRDA
jgi:predicted GNAT superfamily acetyltransferase